MSVPPPPTQPSALRTLAARLEGARWPDEPSRRYALQVASYLRWLAEHVADLPTEDPLLVLAVAQVVFEPGFRGAMITAAQGWDAAMRQYPPPAPPRDLDLEAVARAMQEAIAPAGPPAAQVDDQVDELDRHLEVVEGERERQRRRR